MQPYLILNKSCVQQATCFGPNAHYQALCLLTFTQFAHNLQLYLFFSLLNSVVLFKLFLIF